MLTPGLAAIIPSSGALVVLRINKITTERTALQGSTVYSVDILESRDILNVTSGVATDADGVTSRSPFDCLKQQVTWEDRVEHVAGDYGAGPRRICVRSMLLKVRRRFVKLSSVIDFLVDVPYVANTSSGDVISSIFRTSCPHLMTTQARKYIQQAIPSRSTKGLDREVGISLYFVYTYTKHGVTLDVPAPSAPKCDLRRRWVDMHILRETTTAVQELVSPVVVYNTFSPTERQKKHEERVVRDQN